MCNITLTADIAEHTHTHTHTYTHTHTHTHTHIYIYILPNPRGVEFSGEEVIVLPLALIANLFVDELRSRQPLERMYVNNSNCNS